MFPPDSEPGADAATALTGWRFADVAFDPGAMPPLRVAGQPVEVEPRPLEVLAELLRHAGEVVTKEELFESVWQGRPTVEHVLANAVSKLRAVLGPAGAAHVVTVPRVGYRLQGPVQRVEAPWGSAQPRRLEAGQPVPGRESYLLERPLGEGGGSDVWLARHAKLGQQRVFKFADDGARLAALKREYTLYRLLRHELGERDDLARVVDVHLGSAPYFLECEYGGRSLPAWAAETESNGQPRLQALPLEQRLALFVQVARAVAAAHGVGVLHKDIKPGNILVDGRSGDWRACLTDFGSGRLMEPGRLRELQITALGLTQAAELVAAPSGGTYLYLAPEVLGGQSPSMAADVYALGVVLYQLVVGDLRRPMTTGWERAVDDPLLREDIAAATEGQPQLRLGSVQELADRVQRLPQRREQRAAEEERSRLAAANAARVQLARARRPWVLAAMALLVLGLGASTWALQREATASRQAQAASNEAKAINNFMTREVLDSPDLQRVGGSRQITMLDVLRRASARAGDYFGGDPLTEAAVRLHLARTLSRMSATTEADAEFARADVLLAARLPPSDPRLLELRFERVALLMNSLEWDAAKALYEQAATDAGPQVLAAPTRLAATAARARLAALTAQRGREQETVEAARASVQHTDALPDATVDERIEVRRDLATALVHQGELGQAERVLAQLAEPPFAEHPASVKAHAHVMQRYTGVLRSQGREEDAIQILNRIVVQLAAQAEPSAWHLGYMESELGQVKAGLGRYREAVQHLDRARRWFDEAMGPDHQYTRITGNNLARAHLWAGDYAAALALLDANRPWFVQIRPVHGERIDMLRARALLGLGRPAEALALLAPLPKAEPGSTDDKIVPWQTLAYQGWALIDSGRVAEGRATVRAALEGLRRHAKPMSSIDVSALRELEQRFEAGRK